MPVSQLGVARVNLTRTRPNYSTNKGGISFASDLQKFGRIRTVAGPEEAQPGGSGLSF